MDWPHGAVEPKLPTSMHSPSTSTSICFVAAKIAAAMGKSKPDPALRMELGAKFTTTLSPGMVKPQAFIAARTRSVDSRTAASGMPTMEKPGNPFETTTSTATGIARTPTMVAEYNEHRSCIMSRTRAEGVHDMFYEAPRVRHRLNGDHVETHTSIDPIVGRQEAIGNTFRSALRRRNRFLRKAFIAARARFHLDKHQTPVIESDDIGLTCSARPVAL